MANNSYKVNFTDDANKDPILVEDRELNDYDTSLSFPGRGITEYGKYIAENFLHLMENFANSSEPSNPVEGQTWYDTSTGEDRLKVYNGTRWVPASGIFKAASETQVSDAVKGDLWVDTSSQQLYLRTNSSWVLVGPEFSKGSSTGPRAVILNGTDDLAYTVLIIDVDEVPVVILSGSQFKPKTAINGFVEIKPGVNLNTSSSVAGIMKFHGLAESAESLRIQNRNIPAASFLRNDVDTTANGILSVKNNQGIKVGDNNQFSLQTSDTRSILRNNFNGGGFDFILKSGTENPRVLSINTVAGETNAPGIGINTTDPAETLDIVGTMGVSGEVKLESTTQTNSLNQGALQVWGGASIAKNLRVGEDVNIGGSLTVTGSLVSSGTTTSITGFETIIADEIGDANSIIRGNIIAQSFTGIASQATRLVIPTTFEMVGEVVAPSFTFDGADNSIKTFNTTISNSFIASKQSTNLSESTDEILINRVSGGTIGLFRTTQEDLVRSVPTNPPGLIAPFGGDVAPPGWLLCDGSIVNQVTYQDLFNVIGYKFLDPTSLNSLPNANSSTDFALPDLRGRVPLGVDSMGGTAADRVTAPAADILGNSGGSETTDIEKIHLPKHDHDLRSSGTNEKQYYAIRDAALDTLNDSPETVALNIEAVGASSSSVSGIPTSGDITGGGTDGLGNYRTVNGRQVGAPLNTMDPYTAVNYIIWTGNV